MTQPELYSYHLGRRVTAFSTTRRGGFSSGNYGEFNINTYCGDEPSAIARNREVLCQLLGIGDDRLLMPHQTHETHVALIDKEFLSLSSEERRLALEGVDALMTSVSGVCIGVSTADCIPVLLYDEEHEAVCAVHAGWRGTVARITEKAVAAMTAAYGTRPSALIAQIGPGISLESFEVGQEVYDAFQQADFDMSQISRREAKWHIDLPHCNRLQLLAAGVRPEAIRQADICTYQHPETFFSARRLGIASGRIYTGIMTQE